MIGLKLEQLPDPLQVGIMVDGIRKHYANYSPEELYLSCELNHYGKLTSKIEHYGKFSIDYLSACLKLYDDKKREAIHAEKTKIEPPKPIENGQKALGYHNGRAYYLELEKWVKTTGSLPLFWDWSKCYQFLFDDGQLTDFPKSRMVEIYDRFKSKGISEATVGRFANQGEKQLGKMISFDELSKDDNVKHECRKYVVSEFLTKKFELTN